MAKKTGATTLRDRRAARSRGAIVQGLVRSLGRRSWRDVDVGELVREARVARSTFYRHFTGKEDVLVASMSPMLTVLADRTGDAPARAAFERLTDHLWSNRALAREIFCGDRAFVIERALAARVHDAAAPGRSRLEQRIDAIRIAAARIAIVRAWVTGEVSARPADIAAALAGVR